MHRYAGGASEHRQVLHSKETENQPASTPLRPLDLLTSMLRCLGESETGLAHRETLLGC